MLMLSIHAVIAALGVLAAHPLARTSSVSQQQQQAPAEIHAITVAAGQTVTLSATDVRNFSVANAGAIDVRVTPDGKSFLVTGRVVGSTVLTMMRKDNTMIRYDVTVTP